MDLRSLRYFVLVAEEGSVHGGARRALVAQPALSVALKKLEREIGAALFERSPRGVTLTPIGAALLPRARHILRYAGEAAEEALLLGAPGAEPAFTIGLLEGQVAAAEITGPILQAFQRSNLDLRIETKVLDFADQFDCLLDGTVDAAIVRAPCDHPDLVWEPLFSEPCVLVASPEHRLASLEETSLDVVIHEPMLEVVRAPRAWRAFWNLAEIRNEAGRSILSPAVNVMNYSLDVLRHAALSPMAASGARLGGCTFPLRSIRLADAPRSVAVVAFRRDQDSPRVRSLVSVAREVTDQLLPMIPGAEPVPHAG